MRSSPSFSALCCVPRSLELRRERFALAGKNADVAADRDQQASQVEPVSGIGFHGSEDAGYLSRGAHTPNRVIDSGPHFRMRVVAQMPHIRRQVARADEQPIYSVYGRNRFQVSERGSSLNLHDYTDLVMHPLEILLHRT